MEQTGSVLKLYMVFIANKYTLDTIVWSSEVVFL